ncbi:MAG TPA: phosphatase PAP2 family protein [Longimicrobiales bacterium]
MLNSTLRLLARHVKGFFAPLAAFVTVGLIVAAAGLGVFALLAEGVEEGITQRFDESVLHWFAQRRTPSLDETALEITTLGNGLVLVVIVLVASVFLWQTQHKWSASLLLFATITGKLLNTILKLFYDRTRPSVVEALASVSSPSFPSGHAMSAMVVYGSVAYLVGRLEPGRNLRITTWTVATLVILAIGISRMYLGVHYPSDVVAGFIAGLAWLGFLVAAMRALQFFARRRPETHAEEKDLDADAGVNAH